MRRCAGRAARGGHLVVLTQAARDDCAPPLARARRSRPSLSRAGLLARLSRSALIMRTPVLRAPLRCRAPPNEVRIIPRSA